jgi:hypothetical protein
VRGPTIGLVIPGWAISHASDIVRLQPTKAGFTLLDDVASTVAVGIGVVVGHAAVDLGSQHNALASIVATQRGARDFFALSASVYVGGIEKVDASVERAVDDRVTVWGEVRRRNIMQPRHSEVTGTPVRPRGRRSMVVSTPVCSADTAFGSINRE